uniref:Replication factor A C-terminal domain-containing protein n=1 Tax=Monopterus albus TaxID=43700 RepID=A0A3Q3IZN4_MONAL
MSTRRALVQCVVLSLQDACVFYPCCKCCFSKIDAEQQDTTRFRCSRCGYSCVREQVDYRYRLSLRVARDPCIFGVTVFGTCLNPFFGIHASGIQRLVNSSDEPVGAAIRSTLLVKAVKDCFIGRHFIFGIKVTGTECGHWLGGRGVNGSSSKGTVQFIASQMILPKAPGLGGCTVVSYYQALLQKAASGQVATTLLQIPHHSPASSFSITTLSALGRLPQSLQRSQHQDCTLTPTPPWQQSLGLVDSSAEQEEGCSAQVSGDENNRQADNYKTPAHAQRANLESSKVTEARLLSPFLSLEHCSYYNLSFDQNSSSSIEKAVAGTPTLNSWCSPLQPVHKNDLSLSFKTKGVSPWQLTRAFGPNSLAWDDVPFSESLTEFLCKEKDFDSVIETEPHLNLLNQKETARNNLEIRLQEKNLSTESTCVCQSNTQTTESWSRILMDITNAPNNGSDRCDLSNQVCKNPAGCVNKSEATIICSHECNQDAEEDEDNEHEGDTYDCSADLFSSSPTININTEMLNTHAETIRTTAAAWPQVPSPHKQERQSGEKGGIPHSVPHTEKLRRNKCINRDSLTPPVIEECGFIPPSQSTPSVKLAVVSGSRASSYSSPRFPPTSGGLGSQPYSQEFCAFTGNLPDLDMSSRRCLRFTEFLCKEEKDFDGVSETQKHLNVHNQKETVRNNLEIQPEDKNRSTESTCVVGCVNKSQSRSICCHECHQDDEEARCQSFEDKEEQLEGDTYDCSADLFSSSLTEMYTETAKMTAEAWPLLSNTDKQPLRSNKVNVPNSTPHTQNQRSSRFINRNSLIPPVIEECGFIPPSQSTPSVKLAVVSRSPPSSYSSSRTSSRRCRRFTPSGRFWKPEKYQHRLLAQQHLKVHREAVSLGPAVRATHKEQHIPNND